MHKAIMKLILSLSVLLSLPSHSKEKITLPIATEDYPPYEMKQAIDGLRGFDYEVASAVFERLGYDVEIEFLPWKRALVYAEIGKVVGILTCAYTKERAEFIHFSDPISTLVNGFYVLKGFKGAKPTLLKDIVGKNVASISDYESLKALQLIGADPLAAPNTSTAIKMLQNKRFDYLYLNQQSTDFQIKKMGLNGAFDFYPISKQDFYFCFSKQYEGYEQISEKFNKALSVLKESGEYEEIHKKYK